MHPDPIAVWHETIAGKLVDLEDLLADDVIFESPAMHAPQAGKPIVAKYLRAAMAVLNKSGDFRYTGEWRGERSAVLEFESRLGDLALNGVDIIHWNDAGRIVQFKVMMRPMKALAALVAAMGEQLKA
jgi:hypothetical protein